ncbi:hypothetical protein HYU06_06165 [Candidatus Woesearchaeota archaeon]|nr:hypothetical protein [Candidatus Woesearchaeota archaeon]
MENKQTDTKSLHELIQKNEDKYILAREELQKAYLLAIAPTEKLLNDARQQAYMVMQIDLIPVEQLYLETKAALEALGKQ